MEKKKLFYFLLKNRDFYISTIILCGSTFDSPKYYYLQIIYTWVCINLIETVRYLQINSILCKILPKKKRSLTVSKQPWLHFRMFVPTQVTSQLCLFIKLFSEYKLTFILIIYRFFYYNIYTYFGTPHMEIHRNSPRFILLESYFNCIMMTICLNSLAKSIELRKKKYYYFKENNLFVF